MSYRLRDGGPDDAAALSALRFTCQRETYGPLYGPEYVTAIQADPGTVVEDRAHLSDPHTRVVLAEDHSGVPVGLAIAADGPMAWERELVPEIEPMRELVSLYTRARTHGSGLGARLLAAALEDTTPDRSVYLWIVDGNHRAEAFYRKHGFVRVDDPALPCEGAWAGQSTFRMRRVPAVPAGTETPGFG